MNKRPARHGAALVVALLTLMVVMLITGAVLQALLAYRRQAMLLESELQAEALAEAAVERALTKLDSNADYHGEDSALTLDSSEPEKTQAKIETEIQPAAGGQPARITATVKYPVNSLHQVTVERVYPISQAGNHRP